MTIILFNLNHYLGGGEVLLIRMAQFLHNQKIDYRIITLKNSYIENESKKLKLNYTSWPLKYDNVVYMNQKDKKIIIEYFKSFLINLEKINIFTFCFRDIYNAHYFFESNSNLDVSFSAGVYHPDDTKYLSRLEINKDKFIIRNREITKLYYENDSIIFCNEGNFYNALSSDKYNYNRIIPLPVKLFNQKLKVVNDLKKIKIIWLGRFVDFKMSGILMMIDYVSKNKNINFDLIGYGKYKKKLIKIVKKKKLKNIKILNAIHPSMIKAKILEYNIGFCTGTSVLEVAKYGIPTIISPMMNINQYKKFSDPVCNGLFSKFSKYNIGETFYPGAQPLEKIENVVNQILSNYDLVVRETIEYVKNFSDKKVFMQYLDFFNKKSFFKSKIEIPKISLYKYILMRLKYILIK